MFGDKEICVGTNRHTGTYTIYHPTKIIIETGRPGFAARTLVQVPIFENITSGVVDNLLCFGVGDSVLEGKLVGVTINLVGSGGVLFLYRGVAGNDGGTILGLEVVLGYNSNSGGI